MKALNAETLVIDIGVRKEKVIDFSGVHLSVNLSSGETSFEIGLGFRTRIEF